MLQLMVLARKLGTLTPVRNKAGFGGGDQQPAPFARRGLIDGEHPVMIANSDQFVDLDIDDYLAAMDNAAADGIIMTMKADDPKWSFVGFNEMGTINRVVGERSYLRRGNRWHLQLPQRSSADRGHRADVPEGSARQRRILCRSSL